MIGADENYLLMNGFKLSSGRNMNATDVQSARNVCLVGHDVATRLFNDNVAAAVNSIIRINDMPYRVLGVLASRGSSFGFSRDNLVILSYENIDRNFSNNVSSYTLAVMTDDIRAVDDAMGEAEGTFRAIRKLNTTEEDNFVLDRNDAIAEKAMNSLGFLTISATVIGLITLIGAAIGLMNIMLVSVTERTKEVGLIKAIGGKSKLVRRQFLLEAIIISLLGALFGILLGVGVGNLFSMLLNTGFVVPWNWVIYGILICTIVGLLAGLYPALKAGKLNPIEALRYE
jgi:putative ABC transport system permease protein